MQYFDFQSKYCPTCHPECSEGSKDANATKDREKKFTGVNL